MSKRMKGNPRVLLVALLIMLITVLSACGGSDKPTSDTNATSTPNAAPSGSKPDTASKAALTGSGYSNNDLSNTRSAGGSIKNANVATLKPAWTRPLTAQSQYGAYASIPVITGGVIY
jgi:glucose dehydrogenase